MARNKAHRTSPFQLLCFLMLTISPHLCDSLFKEYAYHTDQYFIDPEVALGIPTKDIPYNLIHSSGMEFLEVKSYPAEEEYWMPTHCHRLLAMNTRKAIVECEESVALFNLHIKRESRIHKVVRLRRNSRCFDVIKSDPFLYIFCEHESLVYGTDLIKISFDYYTFDFLSEEVLFTEDMRIPEIEFKYARKIFHKNNKYFLFFNKIHKMSTKYSSRSLDFELASIEKEYWANKFVYLYNTSTGNIHKIFLGNDDIRVIEKVTGGFIEIDGRTLLKVVMKSSKSRVLSKETLFDIIECDIDVTNPEKMSSPPENCTNYAEITPDPVDYHFMKTSKFIWMLKNQRLKNSFTIEFSGLFGDNKGLHYKRNIHWRTPENLTLLETKMMILSTNKVVEEYEMLDGELIAFYSYNQPQKIKFVAWIQNFHENENPTFAYIYPDTKNLIRVIGKDQVCGNDFSHISCYDHISSVYATGAFEKDNQMQNTMVVSMALSAGSNFTKINQLIALESIRNSYNSQEDKKKSQNFTINFYPGRITHIGNINFVNSRDGFKRSKPFQMNPDEVFNQASYSRLLYYYKEDFDPQSFDISTLSTKMIIKASRENYALFDLFAVVENGWINLMQSCESFPINMDVQFQMCKSRSKISIKQESKKVTFIKHLDVLVMKQQMKDSIKFDLINMRHIENARFFSLNQTDIISIERFIGVHLYILSSNPGENRINFYEVNILTGKFNLLQYHIIHLDCLVSLSLEDSDFRAAAVYKCKNDPVKFVFFNAKDSKIPQIHFIPKVKLIPAKNIIGTCMIRQGVLMAADYSIYLVNPQNKGTLIKLGFHEIEKTLLLQCLTGDLLAIASPAKLLILNSKDIMKNRYNHGNVFLIENTDFVYQIGSELIVTTGHRIGIPDNKFVSLNRVDLYGSFTNDRNLRLMIQKLEKNPNENKESFLVFMKSIAHDIRETKRIGLKRTLEFKNYQGEGLVKLDDIFDYRYPIFRLKSINGQNCIKMHETHSEVLFKYSINSVTTFRKELLYLETLEGESSSVLKFREVYSDRNSEIVLDKMNNSHCRDLTVLESSSFEIEASKQKIVYSYSCFTGPHHYLIIMISDHLNLKKTIIEVDNYEFDEIFYLGKEGMVFVLALQDTIKKTLDIVEVTINDKNGNNVRSIKKVEHFNYVDLISSALVNGKFTFGIKTSGFQPLSWYRLTFNEYRSVIVRLTVDDQGDGEVHNKAIDLFKLYKVSETLTRFAAVFPVSPIELYEVFYSGPDELKFKLIDRNFYPIGAQPFLFQMAANSMVLYFEPIKAKEDLIQSGYAHRNPQIDFSGIVAFDIVDNRVIFSNYHDSSVIGNGRIEKIKLAMDSIILQSNQGEVTSIKIQKPLLEVSGPKNGQEDLCKVELTYGPESITKIIPLCQLFKESHINGNCDIVELNEFEDYENMRNMNGKLSIIQKRSY